MPEGLLSEQRRMGQEQQPQEQSQGERQPTPEQAEQLELFIEAGSALMTKQFEKSIIKMAKAQDPRDALAQTIVAIIVKLETKIQAVHELDPEIMLNAANVLLGKAIKIYEEAGGDPLSEEEKLQALTLTVATYLDDALATEKISQDEYNQIAEIMKQTPEGQQVAAQLAAGGESMEEEPVEEPQAMPEEQPPQRTGLLGA
jgi:hypothetical protein